MPTLPTIAIIGSGPAALAFAATIDSSLFDVHLFEKNKTAARKFLVAGDGGLNITHSEPIELLKTRYQPPGFLDTALSYFNNSDLQHWLHQLGIPTFIGSSGRVFPEKGIKPIQVLQTLLDAIASNNINTHYDHEWIGFLDNNKLLFQTNTIEKIIAADYTVFALGGGSWKVTGANDKWFTAFEKKSINPLPFQAANCACKVNWPSNFADLYEGTALKNIALQCNHISRKGELVITKTGLEGGAIYWLSAAIRNDLKQNEKATLLLDLKPAFSEEELLHKLTYPPRRQSMNHHIISRIHLSEAQLALLKQYCDKDEFLHFPLLVKKIKYLPIPITSLASIEESISTVGGIPLTAVDKHFQLEKMPNNFVIGEMLNWDAPTGGYLLQAAFSMGKYLGNHFNTKLAKTY
jgi:uncharacterized flavoprotein (TIGR03862 family)